MIQFSIEVYASKQLPMTPNNSWKIFTEIAPNYTLHNGDFRLQYKHSRGTRVDADADYFLWVKTIFIVPTHWTVK